MSDSVENPMDCSLPGSIGFFFFFHRIFQARILEWVAIFLLQGIFLAWGLNLRFLHWQAGSFPLSHWGSLCIKSKLPLKSKSTCFTGPAWIRIPPAGTQLLLTWSTCRSEAPGPQPAHSAGWSGPPPTSSWGRGRRAAKAGTAGRSVGPTWSGRCLGALRRWWLPCLGQRGHS